mgnify:CR=1 FL=1
MTSFTKKVVVALASVAVIAGASAMPAVGGNAPSARSSPAW